MNCCSYCHKSLEDLCLAPPCSTQVVWAFLKLPDTTMCTLSCCPFRELCQPLLCISLSGCSGFTWHKPPWARLAERYCPVIPDKLTCLKRGSACRCTRSTVSRTWQRTQSGCGSAPCIPWQTLMPCSGPWKCAASRRPTLPSKTTLSTRAPMAAPKLSSAESHATSL